MEQRKERGDGAGEPVDDEFPDHLFRWADAVSRRLSHEIRADAPARLQSLGGRRSRLLQMISPSGMSVTGLAHRAGVSKQAIGQLVDTLEEIGLVESAPSTSDRRVRWVRRTEAGERTVAETMTMIASAEDRLRREVGEERYDSMVATMRELSRDVRW
ncbi:MAG: MarR family transcriptional regulator [Terracoccus sp.]